MKQYRNEWKYTIHEKDIQILFERLDAVLEKDRNAGEDGYYSVHSIYFDDYTNTCAKENEAGVSERFKYRIRYYGTDNRKLRLERKEKTQGRCHKETAWITEDTCRKLMSGDVSDLFWETDHPLVRQFCVDIMNRYFTPKIIVNYERIAFTEIMTNVRITFDKNISVSDDFEHFLSGGYLRIPLQPVDEHVLEVKFDEVLPGYIKNILTKQELIQSAFSKYYLGRMTLQNYTR